MFTIRHRATPARSALWCFLRGETDPGELLHRERKLVEVVAPAFEVESATLAFKFAAEGRDLSGYEDGTENPFGRSLRAFEVLLHRMVGLEDGITDALFSFTRPETGAAFFCPPIDAEGRLDLGALGI